jgi:formate hydrogenlyase subunit 6/NADH:ubiquinone oxidoreductase subunit I
MGVFEIVNHTVEASRAYLCVACFKCRDFCPTKAITPRWVMRVS